ncbi:MAG TPA: flavodoxin family protein [Candidatus Limiplasma sp.]|nr:flavodoxin family protein [Candidatus Limiplasma sp.]
MKTLLVVVSVHHQNTLKVAQAIADVLQAAIVSPEEVDPDQLNAYDLVGFGSGIYSGEHHKRLLAFANTMPVKDSGKAFVFSTDGAPRMLMKDATMLHGKMLNDHTALWEKLTAKGYEIIGDFNCAGYNTNSFLKLFGGLNKGRPNAEDLARAVVFARELMHT